MWRLKMRTAAAALIAAGALAGCGLPALGEGGRSGGPAPVPGGAGAECTDVPAPRDSGARQMRGMWIATVVNIDWPQARPDRREQQAEYLGWLDLAGSGT